MVVHQHDAKTCTLIDLLIDSDNVVACQDLLIHKMQRALAIVVQPRRYIGDALRMNLDKKFRVVDNGLHIGWLNAKIAEIIVSCSSVIPLWQRPRLGAGGCLQAIFWQQFIEQPQHMTGLHLQNLLNIVLINLIDSRAFADKVDFKAARCLFRQFAYAIQAVVYRVVIVDPRRPAKHSV
ncbi:hypothetical protein D3C73_1133520 [compost metagenome]